jgi:hypothetical protein
MRTLILTIAAAVVSLVPRAQQPAADAILTNGKIIPVDDRFTIAPAIAIRGDRIVAVGSDAAIVRLPERRRVVSTCAAAP